MSEDPISSNEFRREVESTAGILRERGFRRAPQFEVTTPTMASVVYLGKNVAFTFTLDIRDQAIDVVVTRIAMEGLLKLGMVDIPRASLPICSSIAASEADYQHSRTVCGVLQKQRE